jgi:hypothetical protein
MDRVELRGSRGRGISTRQAKVGRGRSGSLQRANRCGEDEPIQISSNLPKEAQEVRAHLSFQAHSLPLCTANNNLDTVPSKNKPMLVPMTAPTLLGTQEANQTASVDGIAA